MKRSVLAKALNVPTPPLHKPASVWVELPRLALPLGTSWVRLTSSAGSAGLRGPAARSRLS